MKKPRILLSGSNASLDDYINAVNGTSGIADAKYLPEVDLDYDGLILCGGCDIHPERYGQPINGAVNMDEQRDAREWELLGAYVGAGKPVLGVCRGHQLLNVYFGGTLIQDLPNVQEHRKEGEGLACIHPVCAEDDSIVQKLYGKEFVVNSIHHQAVGQVGKGLKVTMRSDSVVEGLEHETLPILSVQWHPERMCFEKTRSDTVDGRKIFEYFIQLCSK